MPAGRSRRSSLLGSGALAQGAGAAVGQEPGEGLTRVAEITAVGLGNLDLDTVVPHRRLVDLARYGLAAKAPQLRRHPPSRRIATLLATVVYLEARSIDDCLELFDLLMVTELVGKADREAKKEKVRQHPRLARASAKLAAAVEVLLEATTRGEAVALDDLWELIEAVVPRTELQAAIASVAEMVPPEDPGNDGEMRAGLASRILAVSGFLKTLTETDRVRGQRRGGPGADGHEAHAGAAPEPAP
jgi:hypothetical protein